MIKKRKNINDYEKITRSEVVRTLIAVKKKAGMIGNSMIKYYIYVLQIHSYYFVAIG